MKMESEVWRLSQVDANFHFPLEDAVFLKGMEEHQLRQNEEMALWSMRSVLNAERIYQEAQGGFACTFSALGGGGQEARAQKRVYLWDAQLASGKKDGYVFTIRGAMLPVRVPAILPTIASRLSLRYRARVSGRFVPTKVAQCGCRPMGRRLLASLAARLLSRKFLESVVLALFLKVSRLLEHRKLLDESVFLSGSLKGSSSPRWHRLILN